MWDFIDTTARRLAFAKQVALAKWDSGKAVEDRAREQNLLSKAMAEAEHRGLIVVQVEQWMRDQMEANKLIQYALLAQWRRVGLAPIESRSDLVTVVRPQLERLQNNLLQQWVQTQRWRAQPACPELLAKLTLAYTRQHKMDTVYALALDRALANVCHY
jgi:chorismate mutase